MAMEHIDFAIVGGGVSGAYAAWRLKQAYPDRRVVLFEYSDRIGGRLLTRHFPELPGVNAELGGMRYIPEQHRLVGNVIRELGLQTKAFPMGSADDPQGLQNYAYMRGRHMRIADFGDSTKVPYNVSWAERNMTPDALQAWLMRLLVPNWADLSPDDWFNVEALGRPLRDWGFWNLLYRMLTPEAYAFFKSGSGYDTNASNGSALVLLPTGAEYKSSNTYRTPVDGMEALPRGMASAFSKAGGHVRTNYRLDSIRRQTDGQYTLGFVHTETKHGHTHDVKSAEPLLAEHVILAMPRRSLESIDWPLWREDGWLRKNLPSVLNQGAIKIVLAYRYAWWTELGLVAGRSISDMPLRQTFYFTSEVEQQGKPQGLIIASYSDIESIPFWKGLEEGPLYPGPAGFQASVSMVAEVHRQVMELHGLRDLPTPYAAAYQDWSKKPYGAAWHCWKAGYDYSEIVSRMRHPIPSEKVYICGDAYSNDQGWAEGALETAELMLTEDIGVRASTLTADWRPNPLRRLRY